LWTLEHWELDDSEIDALSRVEEYDQSQSSEDEVGSEDNFVAEPEEVSPTAETVSVFDFPNCSP
jgi:hypothetical protein